MTGQTLGHYRVLEQIGAGGMSLVFRAHGSALTKQTTAIPPGDLPRGK